MKKLLFVGTLSAVLLAGCGEDVEKDTSVKAEESPEEVSEELQEELELKEKIKEIKDGIELADHSDDIEWLMRLVSMAEGIDESIDYELEVALTFAKMRISTRESVLVQEDPSYVRTTTEEDGSVTNLVRLVHPSYNGILSERIKKIVGFYPLYDREGWVAEYNEYNNIPMRELSIGMTGQEVIDLTTWGRPQKINKRESAYGVTEQWVYPNYQYLYFEDGILTSISTNK